MSEIVYVGKFCDPFHTALYTLNDDFESSKKKNEKRDGEKKKTCFLSLRPQVERFQ